MAEKFKEQAVIISQEEIAPAIYSLWIKTDKIAQYAKAGQFILFTVRMEADCSRVRSVSAKLTKRIVPCIWYIVLQAQEPKNFPRSRPEIISL